MTQQIQVIKITTKTWQGWEEVDFFAGIGTNSDGHLVINTTKNILNAMIFTPLPESTIGGRNVKNLVEFVRNSFKNANVAQVTYKLDF